MCGVVIGQTEQSEHALQRTKMEDSIKAEKGLLLKILKDDCPKLQTRLKDIIAVTTGDKTLITDSNKNR